MGPSLSCREPLEEEMGTHLPTPEKRCGRCGSIPELQRAPGGGNGNPLQYSCLENPMDRGASQATVDGIAKSWT